MRRLFGRAKEAPPAPTLDDAVSNLDKRGGGIDDKIKRLDEELRKHKEAIARARPGPAQEAAKQRALRILKQKKMYEAQRDQLFQQQFNIEQTSFTLQSMQDTKLQVQVMKAAAKDMKTQFKSKELDINAIDKLTDDMADLMYYNNEIQEAMGRNYAVPDDLDEEELLGELDSLETELAMEKETATPDALPSYMLEPDLPAAPSGVMPAHPTETDPLGLPAVPRTA